MAENREQESFPSHQVQEVYRIVKSGSKDPLPPIDREVTPSDAVVRAVERLVGLPEGAKKVYRSKNEETHPCDQYHVKDKINLALEVKKNTVDQVTGLETYDAFRESLAEDLREAYERAVELTSDEQKPLAEVVTDVKAELTGEYQQHADQAMIELLEAIEQREFASVDQKNQVTEKAVRRLLRREILLSHMSTQVVCFTDTKGMAAANTWNEKHQRSDMGPQDTTDETALKKIGRTKQALSVYLGSSEYSDSVYALEGDRVKVWEDEEAEDVVDPNYYFLRATHLCNNQDLMHANGEKIVVVPYRLRPKAGDEGIARVMKNKLDDQGVAQPMTEEDIAVAERLLTMSSYAIAGEYSEDETVQVLGKFNETFGSRSRLQEFKGKLPLILIDRIGSVRLDTACLNTQIPVEGDEDVNTIIDLTIEQARTDSENRTGKNKAQEEMVLLMAALNGDLVAQVELASLDKRFPVNPKALQGVLESDDFKDKAQFTMEDMQEIFNRTKLRTSDVKPQ